MTRERPAREESLRRVPGVTDLNSPTLRDRNSRKTTISNSSQSLKGNKRTKEHNNEVTDSSDEDIDDLYTTRTGKENKGEDKGANGAPGGRQTTLGMRAKVHRYRPPPLPYSGKGKEGEFGPMPLSDASNSAFSTPCFPLKSSDDQELIFTESRAEFGNVHE
jgi:hypothetical protein